MYKFFTAVVLFSLLSFQSFCQNETFDANWKKINELEKKGLTKSALEEVIKIYQSAFKSNNTPQQIKAAMYQIKYRNMVEEDASEKNIVFVDTLIKNATTPAKNILQNMQAEMLWRYKQNNRWKFQNRTTLQEEKSTDISTWSLQKLNDRIIFLYNESLKNETILKNTNISAFDVILEKGENTRKLRPTLFDFLAFRALEFYSSNENDIPKPSYKFIINDPAYFSAANNFINLKILSKDSSSAFLKSLQTYQRIIKLHLNDNDPSALTDADLLRLAFVNQNGVFADKETLYEQSLLNIEKQISSNTAVAQVKFLRAQLYFEQGSRYNYLTNPINQFKKVAAKNLCDSIVQSFPKSEGAINSHNLINTIISPTLESETEKVNIPKQPFRAFVKYNSTDKLYLRIYKTTKAELQQIEKMDTEDEQWKSILNKKNVREWSVDLKDVKDYQQHATEIKIDGLDQGLYFIFSGLKKDFTLSDNVLNKQLVYISNIAFLHNNDKDYYVVNRETGSPLANAQIQLWKRNYNYSSRSYEYVKEEKYVSDKNGHFSILPSKEYRSFILQIQHNGDEYFMDEELYNYQNSPRPVQRPRAFIFTDRSIYLPGQKIFFKGIVYKGDTTERNFNILPDFKTIVKLYNANNQVAGTLKLITNSFGSYTGSFIIPEGQLNGNFYISDSTTGAMQYIKVEEYKRPKFYVEIPKPSGNYQLNDSIHITGTAVAYAGNNISEAKVVYRVVRKVHYPYYYSYKSWWPVPSRNEIEVSNGITTTKADGTFDITFKAIADETVDKNAKPIFIFEVSADVTDINGETRSKNQSIAAAWHNLQVEIKTPATLTADSLKNIFVSTININDSFTPAFVNLKIEKLQTPDQVLRTRYWNMPDVFLMTKDEFKKHFPNDAYADEDKVEKYPLISTVFQTAANTTENFPFNLNKKLETGWYKITATAKDKNDIDITTEKFIQLTDPQNIQIGNTPINIIANKNIAQPGDKITLSSATGFDKIFLIQQTSKANNNTTDVLNILNATPAIQTFIINESDRGGINISYAFIKNNRVYTGSEYIAVPYTNKELKITYTTFRDKLLPGANETWKMQISGMKGDKVASELLVSMYDASLDQFQKHNWNDFSPIWPNISKYSNWAASGFEALSADELSRLNYKWLEGISKSYDRLANQYWEAVYRENYYQMKIPKPVFDRVATTANAPELSEVVVTGVFKKNSTAETKSGKSEDGSEQQIPSAPDDVKVQVRKNFNETAFFFPQLTTDSSGNISFSFTIPEALTQWKLLALAHSKEMASAYDEKTIITQKDIMVQPNMPRFMRQGDRAELPVKVVNMTGNELTGTVQLELFDAATNKPIDGWLKNVFPVQYFTAPAKGSMSVIFPMEIPVGFTSVLGYRFKAITKDNAFSDGEENAIPVLSNRLLVTESLPLNMRNTNSKTFRFDKLLNSNSSGSLTNQSLTVEYTSNPMWFVVQALPYLTTIENESSDQLFNRLYANALAANIVKNAPAIRMVFEKWRIKDTTALISNLSKNEELKNILLQETPWVFDAENETQQKKNILLLFDMVRMSAETNNTIAKLNELQLPNGGFSWFKNGPDDRYITQSIITGLGRLKHLNALPDNNQLTAILEKGIKYLDARIKDEYDLLIKNKVKLTENNLSGMAVQYLYMRSFFSNKIPDASKKAFDYFSQQSKKYWLSQTKLLQAMIAVSFQRRNEITTPKAIIASLKQNAIIHPELGMYWKEFNAGGYYWQQSPVESQALIIEAFSEIENNASTISDLKTWLLKQKQTQNWRSSKATADACYALLISSGKTDASLSQHPHITIQLGNKTISSSDNDTEEGTGYFKQTIAGEKVEQGMGNIQVKTDQPSNSGYTSWGAVYWQYFEDMDKISSAATPLQLVKKLFVERNSDKGPILIPVNDNDELQIGDKVKVRIELRVDRNMEYIHMKDLRSAAMEPVNVISQYKYQDGLSYYETTKDASTNFFFSWLQRGTYVFEYPMFITQAGNYSNGITTIQCLYAPEFTSHSNGIRINIATKK